MSTVAVAGCGPAGLAAALLLARAGCRVTLFERFDAPRPIGSGLMLQPTGMAVLDRMGLGERIRREGARIDRLHGMAGSRVVLDVGYRALSGPPCSGLGIHRASLFAALYEAAMAAGLPIETSRDITGSRPDGSRRRLRFADGSESGPFDLVVDALGTRTTLAPPTGRQLAFGALWASLDATGLDFPAATLSQRYRRSSMMAGVLPTGPGAAGRPQLSFFWSLKGADFAAWQAGGLAAWQAQVRALWPATGPLLDRITDPAQLTFARYAHRTLRSPVEQALVHIGDAWHSASPQLGQGANMALLDAWALARAVEAAGHVGPAALEAAIAMRRRHVRLYQALTWLFTPVYQSDSRVLPLLRDRLVGPLSKLWPATTIQAAMVAGLIGNPLAPLGLAGPAG